MALNPTTLGAAMITATGVKDPAGVIAMNALAAAIIAHFVANATITIAGTALAAAVMPGAGTAVVTGTASLT